tara:strand:+ start:75 stop:914 length:840 start_codon:yes stop_codon:yes gene_type:complete
MSKLKFSKSGDMVLWKTEDLSHHRNQDITYLLDTNDFIAGSIINHGCWERNITDVFNDIIKKDFVCIDAGAYLGYYSLQFAKLSKEVHSFEPFVRSYNHLCGNIFVNNFNDKIKAYNCGLGDKNIDVGIFFHEVVPLSWKGEEYQSWRNWGGTALGTEEDFNNLTKEEQSRNDVKEWGGNTCTVKTLDSFNIKPDLIKIDVEGWEDKMIKGGMKTIKKYKPIIAAEVKDKSSTIPLLKSLGYEVWNLNSQPFDEDIICVHPQSNNYKNTVSKLDNFKAI